MNEPVKKQKFWGTLTCEPPQWTCPLQTSHTSRRPGWNSRLLFVPRLRSLSGEAKTVLGFRCLGVWGALGLRRLLKNFHNWGALGLLGSSLGSFVGSCGRRGFHDSELNFWNVTPTNLLRKAQDRRIGSSLPYQRNLPICLFISKPKIFPIWAYLFSSQKLYFPTCSPFLNSMKACNLKK